MLFCLRPFRDVSLNLPTRRRAAACAQQVRAIDTLLRIIGGLR